MAEYAEQVWVDDDGSGTTGTPYTADRMTHIEAGIKDASAPRKEATAAQQYLVNKVLKAPAAFTAHQGFGTEVALANGVAAGGAKLRGTYTQLYRDAGTQGTFYFILRDGGGVQILASKQYDATLLPTAAQAKDWYTELAATVPADWSLVLAVNTGATGNIYVGLADDNSKWVRAPLDFSSVNPGQKISGPVVRGDGLVGPGVEGVSDGAPGVNGSSRIGPGVRGVSTQHSGVLGESGLAATHKGAVVGRRGRFNALGDLFAALDDNDNKLDFRVFFDGQLANPIRSGSLAGRASYDPTTHPGMYYFATNDWGGTLYRSNGTTWVLVLSKDKLIADVSNVASYTFSGLDGNTDRQYKMYGDGECSGGAGADLFASIKPNGLGAINWSRAVDDWRFIDNAEARSTGWANPGNNLGFTVSRSHWSTFGAVGSALSFEAALGMVERVGVQRISRSEYTLRRTAGGAAMIGGEIDSGTEFWAAAGNNIVSLTLNFGGVNFTGRLVLERVLV